MLVVWNILIQRLFEKILVKIIAASSPCHEDGGVTPALLLASIPIVQQQSKSFASQKSFGGSGFGNTSVFAAYYHPLLYRYWWNTRIFPFTKKSYLHRAQWRYCCENIGVAMVTNINLKYYCLYFPYIILYPSFITFLWQAFCDRWAL